MAGLVADAGGVGDPEEVDRRVEGGGERGRLAELAAAEDRLERLRAALAPAMARQETMRNEFAALGNQMLMAHSQMLVAQQRLVNLWTAHQADHDATVVALIEELRR